MAKILVVDDDVTVVEVLSTYLANAGHEVHGAQDGPGAVTSAITWDPDLVILDLMLPGFDGLEAARRMRTRAKGLPIILLTALGEEQHRIEGLSLGADDYVTKPFSAREVVLRVDSVLRRTGVVGESRPLVNGDLRVDPMARSATRGGVPLSLTGREFDLLVHLMGHPGEAFTREQLLSRVWGWEVGDLTTVTVHVRRLRTKVEVDPAAPRRLLTVWGVGYRWEPTDGT